MKKRKQSAILLLGPTGSGKTPLGQLLERRGLRGMRCSHFDFGENLRSAARTGKRTRLLTPDDVKIVAESLKTGRLLKDKEFHIARKILASFIERKMVGRNDLIVLNGLPRHTGQAGKVDKLIDIVAVIDLVCPARIVAKRIRFNAGGDRNGRVDDSPQEVTRKLRIFKRQTAPLLDHYRRKGVRIFTVKVGLNSTAKEMREALDRKGWN